MIKQLIIGVSVLALSVVGGCEIYEPSPEEIARQQRLEAEGKALVEETLECASVVKKSNHFPTIEAVTKLIEEQEAKLYHKTCTAYDSHCITEYQTDFSRRKSIEEVMPVLRYLKTGVCHYADQISKTN